MKSSSSSLSSRNFLLVSVFSTVAFLLFLWSWKHTTSTILFSDVNDDHHDDPKSKNNKIRILQTKQQQKEEEDESSQEQHHQQHTEEEEQLSNSKSRTSNLESCMINEAKKKKVVAVGSYPIGTYICSYFAREKHLHPIFHGKSSCTLTCPMFTQQAKKKKQQQIGEFQCHIQEKASKSESKSSSFWDFMVFHYGKPPVPAPNPSKQMVIFYSGESNITEAKRAKPEYQNQFNHVVSFHHTRRFYFTWTARFRDDFLKFAEQQPQEQENNSLKKIKNEWKNKRIDAAVIFISRCGRGGRDKIIEALRTNGIPIHSFGKCQRTHLISKMHPDCVVSSSVSSSEKEKKGIDRYAEKLCVYRKYRYVLALDNTIEEDYVTEKIYHAFITGAIPIYDGAPNIEDFVPTPKSFISLKKFLKKSQSESENENTNAMALSSLRTNPKNVLDFERLKQEMKMLETSEEEEENIESSSSSSSSSSYSLKNLLGWKTCGKNNWSKKFIDNLYHEEPTCDICNLALRRRCEPNA